MIQVFSNAETLSKAAADFLLEQAESAVRLRGRFSLCLSGGHSPRLLYRLLSGQPYVTDFPWQKTDVFWGDERCVPLNDPQSNAGMALDLFLNHVPIPKSNIYPIHCADSVEKGAREYEKLLRGYFEGRKSTFDVILLGIGQDGHTASLFPNEPSLREAARWVCPVFLRNQPLNPVRVTLTAPCINRARHIMFIVQGEDKAEILREIIEGPNREMQIPAQLIRSDYETVSRFLDESAANLIKRDECGSPAQK
jgi:6-phosphogluconolactonase